MLALLASLSFAISFAIAKHAVVTALPFFLPVSALLMVVALEIASAPDIAALAGKHTSTHRHLQGGQHIMEMHSPFLGHPFHVVCFMQVVSHSAMFTHGSNVAELLLTNCTVLLSNGNVIVHAASSLFECYSNHTVAPDNRDFLYPTCIQTQSLTHCSPNVQWEETHIS